MYQSHAPTLRGTSACRRNGGLGQTTENHNQGWRLLRGRRLLSCCYPNCPVLDCENLRQGSLLSCSIVQLPSWIISHTECYKWNKTIPQAEIVCRRMLYVENKRVRCRGLNEKGGDTQSLGGIRDGKEDKIWKEIVVYYSRDQPCRKFE